jgi:hypothetical protein
LAEGVETQPFMDIPVVVVDDNNTTTTPSFDPTICCRAPRLKPQRPVLRPEDIMIWETAILALEIRKLVMQHHPSSSTNNQSMTEHPLGGDSADKPIL